MILKLPLGLQLGQQEGSSLSNLQKGPQGISPEAYGLCTICLRINSASHRPGGQADPTLPVGHPPRLFLGRIGGGCVDGAVWGWRSRKAPQPGANKRSFLRWGLSWRAAGSHTVRAGAALPR